MATPLSWDIFCRVIDNHGDLGVCWRLACQLATRGHPVRLWVDDGRALAWMAPHGHPGVNVLPWEATHPASSPTQTPGEVPLERVWLEAFGCEAPDEFIAANAYAESAICQKSLKNSQPDAQIKTDGNAPPHRARASQAPAELKHAPHAWVNLEYLTAETYAERSHRLPSPVMSGPARGLTRHFFYPGFTARMGGLLREPDLMTRQAAFDRTAWLPQHATGWAGERTVSLFCYEPTPLAALLQQWASDSTPVRLLVAPGRPTAAVQSALHLGGMHTAKLGTPQPNHPDHPEHTDHPSQPTTQGSLTLHALPHLSQLEFDHLLWACDLNFVRGEDSLVRALWAGKPLVWHIYPQDDGAHWAKLNAFLDWLQAPADLRNFHHHWNSTATTAPPQVDWQRAATCVQAARQKLLAQPDLVTQLLDWLASLPAAAHG